MTPAAKSDLMLVGVTLLAAVSWIMSREAVLLMPPLLFMSLRFLLAGGLLAVIGHASLRAMDRAALRRAAEVGSVFAVAMSCWVMGIFTGSHVGEGAFLTSLGVVIAPVIGRLLFGERLPRAMWLALPMAATGLALLSLRHGFRPEAGQVFYLTSAFIFALFFHLNLHAATGRPQRRRTVAAIPPIALTAVVLTMVGLVSGLFSLLFEPWTPTFSHFTPAMAGWIVASAVVGTAMRFLLQTYAQSLSSHAHGVVIMVVEPVWVALLAAAWLGESMSGIQLAGCALIFGSLLVNRAGPVRDWIRSRGQAG